MFWVVIVGLLAGAMHVLSQGNEFRILQPKGEIAHRERDLLYFAVALSLLVLLPVYAMIFGFALRYREGHKRQYKPNWDSDKRYEAVWWAIPVAIIAVLATVTWVTSHSLDPYKELASNKEPLKVQVVALQWRWLFIYPDRSVASINELVIPKDRPVNLEITSDAPMNSFWIPELAGQIYAMSGMSTKLHIKSHQEGDYLGMSSNISGGGFSNMKFTTRVVNDTAFEDWILQTQMGGQTLNWQTYQALSKPTRNAGEHAFVLAEGDIYDKVIDKYGHASHDAPAASQKETTEEKSESQDEVTDHSMHNMEGM